MSRLRKPRQWEFLVRRAHTLATAGRTQTALAKQMGVSRQLLAHEFKRLGLAHIPHKSDPHAVWRVEGPHQCILSEGICLLCDRSYRL